MLRPQLGEGAGVMIRRVAFGHSFEAPAGPIRFPGAQSPDMPPAPRIGQHTAEIMSALGYSAADVDALQLQRIIVADLPQNATTEI
jgi:crotonobetainyl-CoA:carnitine CoA-transferase CaiB-like acyl-CoA transferase